MAPRACVHQSSISASCVVRYGSCWVWGKQNIALRAHLWSLEGFCGVQVKGEVESGISYLLQKRETDRYRHFLPRILYETASGGRQAPTFELP